MPPRSHRSDRRSFLKTFSAVTAIASLPALRSAWACVPTSHFDITADSATIQKFVALRDDTVMQSFCFDTAQNRLWTLQASHGGQTAGDLYLSWIDLSTWTTSSQYMSLKGFGHGQGFYIELSGSDTWVWVECDALADATSPYEAFGTKVCRFKWVSTSPATTIYSSTDTPGYTTGATIVSTADKYDLSPGCRHLTVTVDPCNSRMLIRSLESSVPWIRIYDLSDVKTNGLTATLLHHFTQMTIESDTTTSGAQVAEPLQGVALYGNFVYYISGFEKGHTGMGTTCSQPTAQPTYLYYQSTLPDDNHAGYSAPTTAGYSLPRREPEGIGVWQASSGSRLVLGFSGPADSTGCGANSFVSSFYSKDTLM
jgi:hypothetical protein